ncbi:unnamed protein product [Rotaria socialis]
MNLMNIEISLALTVAEQQNQQRRNLRNSRSRGQTELNLIDGITTYLHTTAAAATTTTTAPSFANEFSTNEQPCLSEIILTNNNFYDIDFGPVESIVDETESVDIADCQINDDYLTLLNELSLSCGSHNSAFLHSYTNITQSQFCTNLLRIFRDANICKAYSAKILQLINVALPHPNNLPTSLNALLTYMQDFTKCFSDIVERNAANIIQYRQKIITGQNNENNDIPFQNIYQCFLKTVIHQPFISVILHLDGIGLGKSNKLTLWILSCMIVELPPHLRNKRQNMIPLSSWISSREPIIDIWLSECIRYLRNFKSSGFLIHGYQRWFIYFIGVIADCPAMKLVLNHIGHNGYYSCWYCKVSGIHTLNKRQYHFEEVPIMRTVDTYMSESTEAEKAGENIHGHLGTSILHQILDVPLPQSIIMDYMHITLLRHARCVVLQLYASIKPKQRIELDNILRHQRFPHTFNRKMRGIKDTHIKATEMKNLLFYGLLPSFYSYIAIEKVAHITLFICAIRMLHGEKLFGSETGVLAHQLLVAYYKDHTKHYHGLENLVLHLHIHFASQYEKYGSLNYTNCFGQESFLGAFSKNKHGTRHWGDLLMHYFNIDFALQNKNIEHTANNFNMTEGPFDASPKSINIVEKLIMWHEHECGCNQATTCTKIYNRCIINVITSGSRRKRVARTVFTPTQTATIISNYYLLHFIETESYQIAARSSIKKFDKEGFATLQIRRKMLQAKIILAGSLDDCEKELTRQANASQQESHNDCINDEENQLDEENDEIDENATNTIYNQHRLASQSHHQSHPRLQSQSQSESQPRLQSQSQVRMGRSIEYTCPSTNGDEEDSEEHSDSDDTFENNSAPINKRKNMANNVTKKKQRLNIDDQTTSNRLNNQSETTFPGVSIFNLMERKFDIIEKRLLSIENHSGEKMARLTKKIDNLSSASIINKVAIDTYRDENNESFRKDLMYGDIDLLQTMGSTFGDFARKTMKIVFTEEELKERILPPQRSHLSRPSLDLAKFRIVNDAIRIKYKIDSTKYDAFYKNVLRRKLSDFLIEERRRESIKSARDLIRTQMQTNPPSSHQLMPVLVNVE